MEAIERRREKSNRLFLWACSLGMKCGELRDTRADKRVQIGKYEQDPVTSVLSVSSILALLLNSQLIWFLLLCGANESSVSEIQWKAFCIIVFPRRNMSDRLVFFSILMASTLSYGFAVVSWTQIRNCVLLRSLIPQKQINPKLKWYRMCSEP